MIVGMKIRLTALVIIGGCANWQKEIAESK
jgi:hypothetical protein